MNIFTHTPPEGVRKEANDAVNALGFKRKYFVDADHINLSTVAPFVETADFFTLDVASFIGKESTQEEKKAFISSCKQYIGLLNIEGMDHADISVVEYVFFCASVFIYFDIMSA